MEALVLDRKTLVKSFVDVVKNDKRKGIVGKTRYELLRGEEHLGSWSCIDTDMFDEHRRSHKLQGFFEHKRVPKIIDGIKCELVVMRHMDKNKNFGEWTGMVSGYIQAGCEICYYEVTHRSKTGGSNMTPKKKNRKK